MRGKRASIARKKVDLVLVAVRYSPESRRLRLAQGYERRGVVWSDLKLFDREELIERIKAGRRVVTGRTAEIEGDFQVLAPVHLEGSDGTSALVAEGQSGEWDDLNLPLF